MSRTLAEAAAEVLAGSRASAPKEPMHKLDNTGSHLDGVVDLGGASAENPQGTGTGEKAAAVVGKATPPGMTPDAGDKGKSMKLTDANVDVVNRAGKQDVTLDQSLGKTAAAPKMHPTKNNEETEEEVSDEAEVLEEDEVSEEDLEAARLAKWDELRELMKTEHSVAEDIAALFSGENLSEEFKQKAATIFEAAVLTRAITAAEVLEKQILEAAEESINETRVELEEQIDDYMNLVVQEWIAENTVAIESGLKSEIVEGFIAGLKNLFVEHYVDIPEEQVDVVASQIEEIAELTAKVNEALNANAELTKKLNESKKNEILKSVCEGLTATQAEKVKTLAEGVEFTAEGDYSKKVGIIRENYITSTKVKPEASSIQLSEENGVTVEDEQPAMSPAMAAYVGAISRTQA